MAEGPKSHREPFSGEDIYQDLPPPVLDKIKKYHRFANAAIESKRAVISELKRVNSYADTFVRKLGGFETLSPSFVANLTTMGKIENKYMEICRLLARIGHDEAEYLRYVLDTDVVPQTFKLGKEGVVMKVRPLSGDVLHDANGESFRLG